MKELGIFTALDLRAKDEAFLLKHFGEGGAALLRHLPRHRSSAGPAKSQPRIGWRGEHVRAGPHEPRETRSLRVMIWKSANFTLSVTVRPRTPVLAQ